MMVAQIELTLNRLQEIFGGNAVSDEYGIGRHVANLFVTQTYEVGIRTTPLSNWQYK